MEDFENALINFINSNPLPFEAKWYVMRHVFGLVDVQYQKQMAQMKTENTEKAETATDGDR